MKKKYLVEVHDESGKLKQIQTHKTREDITRAYNKPLYIVDKIGLLMVQPLVATKITEQPTEK